MLSTLPTDVLYKIAMILDNIQDVINFSCSNREIYSLFDDVQYTYWGRNMYSYKFISKPIKNMKIELLRIHNFTKAQIKYGHPLWNKEDYYLYWSNLEKK